MKQKRVVPDNRSKWSEPSNIIASVAVLLSIIAVASSIKSCNVSERALDLAKADYTANRSLIVTGSLNKSGETIRLIPLDPAFVLQSVRFKFPKALGGSEKSALPPEFLMHLSSEFSGLQDFIAKQVPIKPGYVKLSLEARVPFLIESVAVAKGALITDRSLYAFVFGFSVYESPVDRPEIRPLGISFVQRLAPEQDSQAALESAWKLVVKSPPQD